MGKNCQPSVVAVGTFDGVHLGHRYLLSELKDYAGAHSLRPVVVTFSAHPLSVIAPDRELHLLSASGKRIDLLRKEVDDVVVLDFDETMLATSAADFLTMLKTDYGMTAFFAGYDTVLGHDRCGGEALAAVCRQLGVRYIDVAQCYQSPVGGVNVSSSHIRRLLAEGDVAGAAELLGYYYAVEGKVVHGDHIGTGLGFPTANVSVGHGLLIPGRGVYAAVAVTPDGSEHAAVVNIGTRPTVTDSGLLTVEAHLLDFSGQLYGQNLTVIFKARIRTERRFDSLDALREQLAKDVAQARHLLESR